MRSAGVEKWMTSSPRRTYTWSGSAFLYQNRIKTDLIEPSGVVG